MKRHYILAAFAAIITLVSCEKDEIYTIHTRTPQAVEFQQRVLTVTPGANLPSNAEAVDLGLSVNWANMNLGASSEKDAGDLYAWGEITPSKNYGWFNYEHNDFHANDEHTLYLTKYCFDKYGEKQDLKEGGVNLDKNDDAAYVQWGSDWRMPTYAEIKELVEKCTFTYNDTDSLITVTGPNGNSIIIAGESVAVGIGSHIYPYYEKQSDAVLPGFWSSTLDDVNSFDAAFLNINVNSTKVSATPVPKMNRCFGLPIRPVSASNKEKLNTNEANSSYTVTINRTSVTIENQQMLGNASSFIDYGYAEIIVAMTNDKTGAVTDVTSQCAFDNFNSEIFYFYGNKVKSGMQPQSYLGTPSYGQYKTETYNDTGRVTFTDPTGKNWYFGLDIEVTLTIDNNTSI